MESLELLKEHRHSALGKLRFLIGMSHRGGGVGREGRLRHDAGGGGGHSSCGPVADNNINSIVY